MFPFDETFSYIRRRPTSVKYCWLQLGFVVAALSCICGPATSAAVPAGPSAAASQTVTLNFVNADIEGVVKAMAVITGKNFVIDPRVKGTVNIISAQPVARSVVYDVFLSALRLQGFTAVEDHGLVKILPEADAKLHRNAAGTDGMQTRVCADSSVGRAIGAYAAATGGAQQHHHGAAGQQRADHHGLRQQP